MAWLSVVLDLLLVLVLGAVLVYAVILNKRLSQLRSNKEELARVINAFNEATLRAEASIPRLRKAADDVKSQLEDRIEKAVSLKDDLAFMIDRGDSMANRLESSVRMARGETMGGSTPSVAPSPRLPSAPKPLSASRPIMSSSASAPAPVQSAVTRPAPARPLTPAASAAPPPSRKESRVEEDFRLPQDDMDDRSEAERALLKALQSVR